MKTFNHTHEGITWKVDQSLNTIATGLRATIELKDETIEKHFGLPKGHGEKYSLGIPLFNSKEGRDSVYVIYSSYGKWRIGAKNINPEEEELQSFVDYLLDLDKES